jgi:hypothetical protein
MMTHIRGVSHALVTMLTFKSSSVWLPATGVAYTVAAATAGAGADSASAAGAGAAVLTGVGVFLRATTGTTGAAAEAALEA